VGFCRFAAQLAVCALVPAALCAQSQQPTAASEISASGIAEMQLAHDHAVGTTTVETQEKTATGGDRSSGFAVSNIIDALRNAGLPVAGVSTSRFFVEL